MAGKCKQHTAAFKRPVWPSLHSKGTKRSTNWPAKFAVHPTLIHGWKSNLAGAELAFANGAALSTPSPRHSRPNFFEQIGRAQKWSWNG